MTPNDSFDDVLIQNQREIESGNSKAWVAFDDTSHDGIRDRNSLKDDDNDEPHVGKCNSRFIRKGGNKFVAAIKSLQCSPRVDKSDYCKLEQMGKPSTNNQQQHHRFQRRQLSDEQPAFFADFENFEPMRGDLPSVSKKLELNRVLEKIDNFDGKIIIPADSEDSNELEIFTCDTDDTMENDESLRKSTEKDDDDDIECLRTTSGLKLDSTVTFTKAGVWTPSQEKPLIENEFSQFSIDSNDTPVTCNKSIILTPKHEGFNHSRNDEQQSGNDDFDWKPPKELLHRSLSLGDSLSPTDEDSPDQQYSSNQVLEASYSQDFMIKNNLNEGPSSYCKGDNDNNVRFRGILPSKMSMEDLKFPDMSVKRGSIDSIFAEGDVLRKVEKIERQEAVSSSFMKMSDFSPEGRETTGIDSQGDKTDKFNSDGGKACSAEQDISSPFSSTVSSFTFSSDHGNNFGDKENQTTAHPEQPSSSFSWKTHSRNHNGRRMQQKSNDVAVNSEPISPPFFWKTHPRVTIKSYHFQQRKATFRKVNTKLKNGRSMH
mmetsp:Transcript_13717/g.32130  ORF Transcript_13717/g.32130 Transcript_13717/m.32130 type:complete len:542 (+) Transcript_13717:136-1761(+)|eukprot:CAMPEP_0197188962 /NCGR_PEP_ID=MMETSP1423-20130617/18868_1 /TAXON_ID=476441 /ORGANISM="Pseudo-nitzschia heimii, Strain UNC1101" /LENGTH=541 /DNA_ID=CAMNT_0042640961 /DNA_START=75 /DNA_END=1700 /DNA_ORIENTATION=+